MWHLSAVVDCLATGSLLLGWKHWRWCDHWVRRNVLGLIDGAGKWNGYATEWRRRQTMPTVVMVVVTVCWAMVRADPYGTGSAIVLPRCRDVTAGTWRPVAAGNQLDAGGCTWSGICPCCDRHMCRRRHCCRTADRDTLRRPSQQRKWCVRLCRCMGSWHILPTQCIKGFDDDARFTLHYITLHYTGQKQATYFSFYPCDAMLAPVYAMAILSACVSHVCFVSKQLNILSKFFYHLIAPSF